VSLEKGETTGFGASKGEKLAVVRLQAKENRDRIEKLEARMSDTREVAYANKSDLKSFKLVVRVVIGGLTIGFAIYEFLNHVGAAQ